MSTVKEFVNVREAARQLGVHENTIRNWEQKQVLHSIKLPGSGFRRFRREDIERMRDEMLGASAPMTPMPDPPERPLTTRPVDDELI